MIYYTKFSRDCDMVESITFGKENTREEYEDYKESCYMDAEGAMSFTEITEEEYLDNKGKGYTRDRIMEAYENGRGNQLNV